MVSGGTDGVTRVWRVDDMRSIQTRRHHTKTIYASVVHPSGRLVATGCSGGTICVWDLVTGEVVREIQVEGRVDGLEFVETGDDAGSVLIGAGRFGVRAWLLRDGTPCASFEDGHVGSQDLDLSRDGRHMVSLGRDHQVRVWSVADGRVRHRFAVKDACSIALHPDLPLVAMGTNAGRVVLRDVDRNHELTTVAAHDGAVFGIDFHPDGRELASGGMDRKIRRWTLHLDP